MRLAVYVGKPGQTAQEVVDNAIAIGNAKAVLTADQSDKNATINIGKHDGKFTLTVNSAIVLKKININSSDVAIDGGNSRNLTLTGDKAVSINGENKTVSNIDVTGLKIDAGGYNVYLPNGTKASDISVVNNLLTSSDNVFYALGLTGSSQINILNNETTNGGTIQIVGAARNDTVKGVNIIRNKAVKNGTTMVLFGWVDDAVVHENYIKSSRHSSSAMTMVGVNNIKISNNKIYNYQTDLSISYGGFSWLGGAYQNMNTPSTSLQISHNTFADSDDAITFRANSLGDTPKFECNYIENTTNAIATKDVNGIKDVNEGQEYSDEVAKCTPAPTTPETNNTDKADTNKADNNAAGAKAPNTGAVSIVETLAAVTAMSAAAIAGAIYIRKRAYSANK